jgi:F0F1-type ATP synthase assembly protein I
LLELTSRFSYLGIFFGIAVVLGYFAGHWADQRWHTDPWLSVAGVLMGVAAGFRELYRLSRLAVRDQDDRKS